MCLFLHFLCLYFLLSGVWFIATVVLFVACTFVTCFNKDQWINQWINHSWLLYTGRPLPAVKPAERVEEKQLLATLHEEGLIQRPIGRGAFTVSFEVMSEMNGQAVRKPPPRLAKLECKKKKKKVLTEAEIRQKLERAEQRRKVLIYRLRCIDLLICYR